MFVAPAQLPSILALPAPDLPVGIDVSYGYAGRFFVLHRAGKLGLGTAHLEGFRWGLAHGYDLLFEMDADFSHDPRHLPQFLAAIRQRADLVLGSRYVRGGARETGRRRANCSAGVGRSTPN